MSKHLESLVEKKIADLQEQVKKQNSDLSEASNAIEKLSNVKSVAVKNLGILDGAIQAYADILTVVKQGFDSDKQELAEKMISSAE